MDDKQWLATRTGITCLGGQPLSVSERHRAGVVVEPTRVGEALDLGVPVIAVVGWPDGRHHSVIKAAEARLAIEQGAEEVWLCVDADAQDFNETLADVVAVRQGVEKPARLALVVAGRTEIVRAGELAGVDKLVCSEEEPRPDTALEVAVYRVTDTLDAIVSALDTGATEVFTARQ